jgi:hypothetical protein
MKTKKPLTEQQKKLNVIKNIKKLLSESDELGDFGKTKTIEAINLKLALDALSHLEDLVGMK